MINTVIEKDIMESTKEEAEASKKLRAERIKLLKEKVESQGMGGQVAIDDSGSYHLRCTVLNVQLWRMHEVLREKEDLQGMGGHILVMMDDLDNYR